MSLTQFTMVEELAFLVKDNLPCKHLILSMEELLVNYLQDDQSAIGVLELKPMNSYSRLLLHRLADIFGFSHHSVGQGDDRHLILERCQETSIPSILVSDLLGQHEELQSPLTTDLLARRKEATLELKVETPTLQFSLEDRKAAYMAARERIFSTDEDEINEPPKQKPQNDPAVARRMIAHALGQRIKPSNQINCPGNNKENLQQTDEMSIQDKQVDAVNLSSETGQVTGILSGQKVKLYRKPMVGKFNGSTSSHPKKTLPQNPADSMSPDVGIPGAARNQRTGKDNLKKEHMGAARRMFAHALGLQSSALSKSRETDNTGSISSE